MPSLAFDRETHTYFLDGAEIPGVTSVLKDVGLVDYRFVSQVVLQRAARFGVAVHRATELWDSGRLEVSSLDQALVPYLDAWKSFKAECGFFPEKSEMQVFSVRHRYAGTLDRVGKIGDHLVLVDIKSGILLPGAEIQTAAYTLAYNELFPKEKVRKRFCVKLDARKYLLKEHKDETDTSTWLSCLQLYNFKKKNNIK